MSETEEDWIPAAEALLRDLWGAGVTCEAADTLRDAGRSRVYRLAVSGAPVASLILKAAVGDEADDGGGLGAPLQRFVSEWAGCEMLAPHGLGPRAYGGDVARRFCVMEDLGAGETLAARLLGDDAVAAEAALLAYARSFGDMHTATLGQAARWATLRGERGGAELPDPGPAVWRGAAEGFASYCETIGVGAPGLAGDLAAIGAAIREPGDYLAFSPADCCPDNHFLRGERVIFFDCEGARMRHALVDAAYFLAPFPTCWCCARLPDGLPERLIAAYRETFPGGSDFEDQLTLALAAWAPGPFADRARAGWEAEDTPWGLSTVRQRGLALMQHLLARPNLATLLPGFARTVESLHANLSARWPDLEPMGAYPAFRGRA
jgi:hypothetical protein